MTNLNSVCKEIFNSRDVTSQRVAEVLISELVSPGHLNKNETENLSKTVNKILNEQANRLVSTVMSLSE